MGLRADRPFVTTHPLANKTTIALATMLALLAIPYATPKLHALRVAHAPWEAEEEPESVGDPRAPTPQAAFAVGDQKLGATENDAVVTNALPATHAAEALDPDEL